MKNTLSIIALLSVFILILIGSLSEKKISNAINIGVIAPITGSGSSYGEPITAFLIQNI